MKRIVTLSKETNRRLMELVRRRYGGKRGAISIVVERALKDYLEREQVAKKLECAECVSRGRCRRETPLECSR